MLGKDYTDQDCALARALEVVGERWTLLILRDAFYGVRRFSDFAAHLDIPRAVLAERLRGLVDDGLLARRPDPERPGRGDAAARGPGQRRPAATPAPARTAGTPRRSGQAEGGRGALSGRRSGCRARPRRPGPPPGQSGCASPGRARRRAAGSVSPRGR